MKRTALILSIIIIGLSTGILYNTVLNPSNNSTVIIQNDEYIELGTYSGYKGVESIVTPLDKYIQFAGGSMPTLASGIGLLPLLRIPSMNS